MEGAALTHSITASDRKWIGRGTGGVCRAEAVVEEAAMEGDGNGGRLLRGQSSQTLRKHLTEITCHRVF